MKRVFGLILVTAVLIVGCDFILGPDKPVGGGNLVIGFGEDGGISLAAVPTAEEQAALRYELLLTGPGGQEISESLVPGQTFNQQVVLGEWHIYAEAYNPGNILIGTGSTVVTVRAGTNRTQVSMTVLSLDKYREMVLATPDATNDVTIIGNAAYAYKGSTTSTWKGVFIAGRTVILSPFKIAKYETTYGLWYEVRQWARGHGYTFTNYPGRAGKDGAVGAVPGADKLEPVTDISWRDAIVWCNAYSEMSGKDPVYYLAGTTNFNDTTKVLRDSDAKTNIYPADTVPDKAIMNLNADGYRLPTEAEWEYAARGGGTPSATGSFAYKYAGANNLADLKTHAWCSANSGGNTHPVGGKQPNTLGLYDMTGNVYEWCWDWHISDVGTGSVTNPPTGPANPPYRILRGGCYTDGDDSGNAVATRGSSHPSNSSLNRGFRVVCRP